MASRASRPVTRAVSSSGVPSGMLTMTWNSFLSSNGSILTVTSFRGTSATAARSRTAIAARKAVRTRGSPIRRTMNRRYRSVNRSSPPWSWWPGFCSRRFAAQGVAMKATTSENSMAAVAPTGMGRM